jgi:RecG-like helicase
MHVHNVGFIFECVLAARFHHLFLTFCVINCGESCRRRRDVRERLAAGEIDIIIGTTALNNPQEIFSSLGLVVIDEQHRFGVKQRAQLVKKNPEVASPHVLFATATPIPRTVAMMQCSHMTTSVIDELPPGRLAVQYASLHSMSLCILLVDSHAFVAIVDKLTAFGPSTCLTAVVCWSCAACF